jgi:hypothetical protein
MGQWACSLTKAMVPGTVLSQSDGHAVFLIAAALFIAAILVPGQGDSRTAMNEASAIGSLRTLTTFQNRYAADNSSKGFACELAQLRDVTHRNGVSDHEAILVSQLYAGYKFVIDKWNPLSPHL